MFRKKGDFISEGNVKKIPYKWINSYCKWGSQLMLRRLGVKKCDIVAKLSLGGMFLWLLVGFFVFVLPRIITFADDANIESMVYFFGALTSVFAIFLFIFTIFMMAATIVVEASDEKVDLQVPQSE